MTQQPGRSSRLSPTRRSVGDFLHAGQQIPTATIERRMNLHDVVAARESAQPRPSWTSIFTKAFAQVAESRPELRRAFVSFPFARLYEHPASLASVVVESSLDGEDVVFYVRIQHPERWPLVAIDRRLAECKLQPCEKVKTFRRSLIVARLPWPIRRLLWWSLLNTSGHRRARVFGTYGVSTITGHGADTLRTPAPWPYLLHYGVVDQQGYVTVRLTWDHRIVDGKAPALALQQLEGALNTKIVTELRDLAASAAA